MSSAIQPLGLNPIEGEFDISNKKFGIVVAEWHTEVTEALFKGAFSTLLENGASIENIIRINVPGSFELSFGAQQLAKHSSIDAVLCIGCLIEGETKHFDHIANAVSNGITNVSLKYDKAVIFGLLTTANLDQAWDRAGGKYGNKGSEAAITAIKLLI